MPDRLGIGDREITAAVGAERRGTAEMSPTAVADALEARAGVPELDNLDAVGEPERVERGDIVIDDDDIRLRDPRDHRGGR